MTHNTLSDADRELVAARVTRTVSEEALRRVARVLIDSGWTRAQVEEGLAAAAPAIVERYLAIVTGEIYADAPRH
jgi:hypothetical protein